MLALLITVFIFAAIIGLARMQLGSSLFRDYFFLPWGEAVDLPPAAEKVWATTNRKPSGLPPDARQAPPHLLAILVNRDRLARPLLCLLIGMARRGLIKIAFNPRSDDFVLHRQPIPDANALSKLDRAMIGKLFPNEASELTVEWRNADIFGEARRLVERANKKRVGNLRVASPNMLLGGLIVILTLLILITVGGTEAGSGGYIVGLTAMIWPVVLFWTAGLALKSKRAHKATSITRYQERFYLMATLSLGICIMAFVNLMVLSIAVGIIAGVSIMLAGLSIPLLRGWFRQSERVGKGHKIAAAWLQHFRQGERQETNEEAAKARLAWDDLGAALAVGAEGSWMAAAQLKVDIGSDSEDDLPDEGAEPPPDSDINPDNPIIEVPEGFSFEQKSMPLLALHHHISDGLWVDLWQALLLDYTIRLRQELPIGKKPQKKIAKRAEPAESEAA